MRSWISGAPLLALVVCGCAGRPEHVQRPAVAAAVPARKPVQAVPIEYALPSVEPSAAYEKVCRSDAAPFDRENGYGYSFDLDPVPLYPLPYGPRIREMPRQGAPRVYTDVYEAISTQREHLTACFGWARHGTRDSSAYLRTRFTIDPFGLVSNVTVEGGSRGLNECVKEGLEAVRVDDAKPRITEVELGLEFSASGPPRPAPAPPRPPQPPRPLPLSRCVELPVPVPTDQLVVPRHTPIPWFKDVGREVGPRARMHSSPPRRSNTACLAYRSRPEDFERAILSNLGAYRECYRTALQSAPGLKGVLTFRLEFGPTGQVEQATVDAELGQELSSCMRGALMELVAQVAPMTPVRVTYQFKLVPTPPPALAERDPLVRARTLLERQDADGALESFAEAIRSSGGGLKECWGRLGVLRAMLVKAPWVDDPRVRAALESFVRYADRASTPALSPCLKAAAPVVAAVGTWPFTLGRDQGIRHRRVGPWESGAIREGVYDDALARAEEVLALSPSLPGRMLLLEFVATGRADRGKTDEAIDALVPLLAAGLQAERLRPLLESLTAHSYSSEKAVVMQPAYQCPNPL